ncbi:MAG: SIMPL domain-containing protein [Caulobacteraceae bacterium]|nr:SIMPL domain-containing protein [Caulobacteraceae bacterium]
MRSMFAAAALAALLAPGGLCAQTETPGPAARFAATTLDLSAYGEVSAPPDMATITLGVTDQAPDAAQALADNAAAMNRVVAALRARGIAPADIQTSQLGLSPQYAYEQGQAPRLTGYEASNQVVITVRDLARLGATVDAVVKAGATNVGAIEFGLRSRVPAENAARMAAVKALQDKAAIYADAAGYRIRRLVNLSEGASETPGPPRPLMMAAAAKAAPTPVEAGELKVRVDVTGEFELTH